MTENPFGGLDMNALMQQAQQMQQQLAEAQQRLNAATVEGTSLGGAVTVTVNGVGELTDVKLGDQFVGATAEDLEDLAAGIVVAYRDAKAKADDLASQSLGPLAGGFDAPGSPFQLGL
ncbi:nucleoid-associated protein [Nocardioides baekrokdamisoli]|uniref:Nucleoid-associated protein Back2_19510 n=1 Tax=Nocardioides baekrokdamisoli TaxID=1804624 RepID=A0A3G9J2J3_9ACTN|nr:YbaB/EbfC family nucleoid-associated protein [Nocardioides baekrokdamisoli]BBH17664.1 nucleoid-associated protein [Nocardioides baekrokdamisoli]